MKDHLVSVWTMFRGLRVVGKNGLREAREKLWWLRFIHVIAWRWREVAIFGANGSVHGP